MFRIALDRCNDLEAWRQAVRPLLAARIAPDRIIWVAQDGEGTLFEEKMEIPPAQHPVSVPRAFVSCAAIALCHRDPGRFALLYRLAYRLQTDRTLLRAASDTDMVMLNWLMSAVRRDSHKMKAFLRFRAVDQSNEKFAAWFEPEHFTLEHTAPFFAERFAAMEWAIFTPYRSAYWNGENLRFGDGRQKSYVPDHDAVEEHWRAYYSAIFNPARLKVAAMRSEMPRKYWHNLPEAELITALIRNAGQRENDMLSRRANDHLKPGNSGRKVPTG